MNDPRPRPRAFRLDDSAVVIEPQLEPIPADAAGAAIDEDEREVEIAQQRGLLARWRPRLATLLWSGLGGLVSLGLGLWFTDLVESLFARAQALGWIAVAFGALAGLALAAIGAREVAAILRQTRIARLHADLAIARARDDREAARRLVARLVALYDRRPETAAGRSQTMEAVRAIIDGRDLVDIAERALLRPLDERVQREIADAAKRVSMVTAISPRAVLDVLFVVAQIVYLIRRIAEIYGGRPGLLGFFKLARSVGAHVAITGGMAVGDSLVQQLVGHGLASKISARLGEGVLNGLLTARVGLSAMAVCRPAPFGARKPPGVAEVAPFLFGPGKKP
ncbi:MAG: TIGR01620 family protein [Roseiarcus sp.]|jgi:putative membrane protein